MRKPLVDVGATAVAIVDEELDLALAVANHDRHHPDLEARIGPQVELEPLDDAGLRLRRQDSRLRPAATSDKERIEADIGADVDEGEGLALRQPPVDRRGERAALDHVEHLRREQRILFATVAARIKPHTRIPERGVNRPVAQPVDHDAAQRHRGPQSKPVRRQAPGQGEHGPRQAVRRVAAVGAQVDAGCHRWGRYPCE